MGTPDETQRALGRLEGRLDAVEGLLTSLSGKVDVLVNTMAEAKGGWKVFVAVGSISGAAGAIIVKLFPFLGQIR